MPKFRRISDPGRPAQAWVPEAGLYYYKARMYSPTLGRFMQTDPIGYAAGLNMYAYVGNDPVNGVDPWGLLQVEPPPATPPDPCDENPAQCIEVVGDKCSAFMMCPYPDDGFGDFFQTPHPQLQEIFVGVFGDPSPEIEAVKEKVNKITKCLLQATGENGVDIGITLASDALLLFPGGVAAKALMGITVSGGTLVIQSARGNAFGAGVARIEHMTSSAQLHAHISRSSFLSGAIRSTALITGQEHVDLARTIAKEFKECMGN